MSKITSDSDEFTATIVHLLPGNDFPTPPASISRPSFQNGDTRSHQTPQVPFKSLNSNFELEEADKWAILAALDSYNGSGAVDNAVSVDMNSKSPVEIQSSSESEETKAAKLDRLRKMAAKRRNRHRARVKAEWQTLRQQDSKLSAKLEKLQHSRDASVSGLTRLQWQAMASKELIARLQAECQQQRIRRDIERRKFDILKLQETFDVQQLYATPKVHNVPTEWTPDDIRLYQIFMGEVTAAHARTDEVFHESFGNNTNYYDPVWKESPHQSVKFVESASSFIIPSHYSKASNVMFDSMRQVHRENSRDCVLEDDVGDFSNTIAVKMATVFHYEEGQVTPFSLTTVLHRFEESDRTVLVWRCLIEGEEDFTGVFLDETGWCILSPKTFGLVDSTDVRICIRSIPHHDEKNDDEVETFAKAVVRSSQQDSLKLAYLMEQKLLGRD